MLKMSPQFCIDAYLIKFYLKIKQTNRLLQLQNDLSKQANIHINVVKFHTIIEKKSERLTSIKFHLLDNWTIGN